MLKNLFAGLLCFTLLSACAATSSGPEKVTVLSGSTAKVQGFEIWFGKPTVLKRDGQEMSGADIEVRCGGQTVKSTLAINETVQSPCGANIRLDGIDSAHLRSDKPQQSNSVAYFTVSR